MTPSVIILNILLFISLYVQVLFLFTYVESHPRRKSKKVAVERAKKPLTYYPSVAIIIPCWNEEKTLAGTIHSLLKLDYPKEKLELVIVDDGSTDKTLQVANSFRSNPQVKIYHKENGGKHTAVNFGIKKTNSELVGCLDADSFVAPDALIEIVKKFQDKKNMAVTPAIRVHEPENMLQRLQRVEYNMGVFLRKMFGEMNAISVTPGPFSIFRRKVFEDLGDYRRAHNTEDMEMALRMHKNYYPIANAPAAFVYTVTPRTVPTLVKQRLRWVYGFLKNVIDYREMIFNKKYGNLGMFSLPAAVISIFTLLYFTSLSIFEAISNLAGKITEYQTVGLHFSKSMLPHFDWFFWDTNQVAIIILALSFSALIIVLAGQRLAEGHIKPHSGLVYFFLFYGLLAPLWVFKAVFNVVFSRKSTWR